MDNKSLGLGIGIGLILGGAGASLTVYKLLEKRMYRIIDIQTKAGIESYKQGLDRAADGVISMEEATELVKKVQSKLVEDDDISESAELVKSFSSLEEGGTPQERVNYSGEYDQYHRPMPSQLFNYDDDIPKEVLDNQLDLEAEAVIQENGERLDRFEQLQAERESPEDDFDPEVRAQRRQKHREMSKKVEEISEEMFFSSNRDYDKETILYYKKDRVMCYENEEIIMDKEEILGPDFLNWLDTFNTTKVTSENGTSLYLRSKFLKTDYEVIIYAGSYEHFVNGPDIG